MSISFPYFSLVHFIFDVLENSLWKDLSKTDDTQSDTFITQLN